MAIGNLLIIQATVLFSIVGGYSFIQYPVFYQEQLRQPPGRHIVVRNEDYGALTCPGEGFFVHPTNCSRFYRCVDYSGVGYYSRYLFECPSNHVFINAAQTCVPGICTGVVQQPVIIVTEAPAGETDSAAPSASESESEPSVSEGGSAPSVSEGESASVTGGESASSVSEGGSASSVSEGGSASSVSEGESASSVSEGGESAPASEGESAASVPADQPVCPNRFVQHPEYCNIYIPCADKSVRYVCPTGTVFDEPRQMCRISAFDDGLCTDKVVFRHAFLLRSENIGAHVVLPDSMVLPRLRADTKPQPRPLRINGNPADTPTMFRKQEYVFDFEQPAFRPIISRPAQVYRRPQSSPYHVQPATFLLKPADVSAVPVVPASTKYRPLAQVRRPEGHLHFPHLDPEHFLNTYGFQREII